MVRHFCDCTCHLTCWIGGGSNWSCKCCRDGWECTSCVCWWKCRNKAVLLPNPALASGMLSQFDAAWIPNTMPDQAATQVPAMALSPSRAVAGGGMGGFGVGLRNLNGRSGG